MDGIQARLEQGGLVKTVQNSTALQSNIVAGKLVAQHWADVNLDLQRKAWEESCLDIANAQEASSVARKNIAESTKAFRKHTDDEKLANWGTLLKSYQAEIDNLTKRSKSAEIRFLDVYKALRDVPDPAQAVLSLCDEAEAMLPLQASHDKIRGELQQYEEEFAQLKNQDVTIRKLEERIVTLEAEMEDNVAAALDKEKTRVDEHSTRQAEEHDKRNRELQGLIKKEKAVNSELQRQYDEAQAVHLEVQLRLDRENQAKQSQIDILSEELERTGARAAAFEREKEQINNQYLELWKKQYQAPEVAREASAATSATSAVVADLETSLAAKEAQAKQLQLQVEVLEKGITAERAAAQEAADKACALVEEREEEVAALKARIAELPTAEDYAKVKRQLRVLQAVEYNMLDADVMEEGGVGEDAEEGEPGGETHRLEEMLMQKNKQLEKRLAEANRQMDSKTEEVRLLQSREKMLDAKVQEQAGQIKTMEMDISRASEGLGGGKGFGSDHLSALLEKATPQEGEGSASDSLASAVAQQRDRFRHANVALEGENAVLKKRISCYESDIRTLRSDNVKMYEKIKFLESYKPSQATQRSHAVDVEASIDSMPNLDRYKNAYEESINPFTVFNQRQKALRRDKMDMAERMLLEASQFFLGHAVARKFLFFYMVIMHFLVFSTLYNFTHTHERCKKLAAQALDLPAHKAAQKLVQAASAGKGASVHANAAALEAAAEAAKLEASKVGKRRMLDVWQQQGEK